MSIVADTLKRLQARSTATAPDVPEEPSIRPLFNQGEGTGRHLKVTGMKFWIIGAGMTVGFAGLALSAFWIGWQLDVGLSTNTHARMNNSRPFPTPSLPAEIQIATQEPPGTAVSAESEVAQPSSPTSQAKEKSTSQTSTIRNDNTLLQDTSSTPTSLDSGHAVFPSEPLAVSAQQQDNSTSEQSVDKDSRQIAQSELVVDESTAFKEEISPPPAEVEPPHVVEIETEEPQEPLAEQTAHQEAVFLEEEFVPAEELAETAKLATNFVHRPSNFTTLKERRESMNPADPTTTPLQPSQTNPLRHAQELLQTGNYEEAVTVLAPLFHEPPDKWQPWFWMGTALLGQEDLEQADQFFLGGLARNDKIPQLWIQRALVAQQRGNYQLAIHELRQAESLNPDLPHIHLNMGYAYEHLGNIRLANRYYGKFLKLSEGNPKFFPTRKKLLGRVAQQTQTKSFSTPSALNP